MIDFATFADTVTRTVNDAAKQFDVTKLDVTKLDLTKLDLTKLDLRNIDVPKFEMPDVQMPSFDNFELPEIDVPAEVERIADFVRDVAYAGIGAGVIAVQKVDAEVRKLVGTSA